MAMQNTSSHHHASGFSLIEQIVTLAVAAILVAISVPSMARLATRSAVEVVTDQLVTAARHARTAAIVHNTHALLCPSDDGHHCSGSTDWQHGWIMALDHDHDNQVDSATLDVGEIDSTKVRIVGSAGRRFLRFRSDGAAAGTNLSLVVCPKSLDNNKARVLIVSNSGRIRQDLANISQQARCHPNQ